MHVYIYHLGVTPLTSLKFNFQRSNVLNFNYWTTLEKWYGEKSASDGVWTQDSTCSWDLESCVLPTNPFVQMESKSSWVWIIPTNLFEQILTKCLSVLDFFKEIVMEYFFTCRGFIFLYYVFHYEAVYIKRHEKFYSCINLIWIVKKIKF